MPNKTLPNYFICTLAQSLAKGAARATVYINSLTTLDGQTVDITAFAQENSTGTLIVDPQGQNTVEWIKFTGIDTTNIAFTGCTGGLSSLGDGASIAANLRFHPTGATVIIGFSSYDLASFCDLYTAQTFGASAVKTFGAFPLLPSTNPTTALQAAHKQYVDQTLAGLVGTASNTTAGTVKTDKANNSLPRVLNVYVQQQSTPNMTLKVLPFDINVEEFKVACAGGNTGTITAPVSNPRIDLVVVKTSDGTIAVRTGSEGASPAVPTATTGDIVLAEIYNRVGETTIKDEDDSTNGYVYKWYVPAAYRPDLPIYGGTTTGSANAYVLAAPTGTVAALFTGLTIIAISNFANTGSATFAYGGTTAKTIKKKDGVTNLASGDIANGQAFMLRYDGTNYQLLSPVSNTPINTAVTLVPAPVNAGATATTRQVNSNTTAFVGLVSVIAPITVNKVSLNVTVVGTTGTLKFGLYSEDGQTQLFNFTTASISGAGIVTTAITATTLVPGNYFIVILPVSTADITVSSWNTFLNTINLVSVSGKPIIEGSITVTASTLPATLTPGSISAADDDTPISRFDN